MSRPPISFPFLWTPLWSQSLFCGLWRTSKIFSEEPWNVSKNANSVFVSYRWITLVSYRRSFMNLHFNVQFFRTKGIRNYLIPQFNTMKVYFSLLPQSNEGQVLRWGHLVIWGPRLLLPRASESCTRLSSSFNRKDKR